MAGPELGSATDAVPALRESPRLMGTENIQSPHRPGGRKGPALPEGRWRSFLKEGHVSGALKDELEFIQGKEQLLKSARLSGCEKPSISLHAG